MSRQWPNDGKPDRFLMAEGYLWLGALVMGAIAVIAFWALPALAHPGVLAADGCHMDRRAGVRHCHQAPNSSPLPRQDRDDDRGTYYPNCAAARAAGAAPVRQGQPGYARHLDRDGDGVGCE